MLSDELTPILETLMFSLGISRLQLNITSETFENSAVYKNYRFVRACKYFYWHNFIFRKSLLLSQELGDKAVEAQACYSLGNTYTLLRDYPKAIEFHLRHLQIAQALVDRVGEGRAYWSLGNAHSAMGEHRQALFYAKQHLLVSKELGDQMGEATAEMNVSDLRKVLGIPEGEDDNVTLTVEEEHKYSRRKSMEEMNLIRMTPDTKLDKSSGESSRQTRSMSVGTVLFKGGKSPHALNQSLNTSKNSEAEDEEEEDQDAFFDMLSRVQADRLDDQRCTFPELTKQRNNPGTSGSSSSSSSSGVPFSASNLSSQQGKPPLVSKGSLKQSHIHNSKSIGNKENKEKKSKTLPARANSLPVPVYSSKPAVDKSK